MRELKWKPEQQAQLSVLGQGACTGKARILDVSGKRLRLAAESPAELKIASGAALRLEWDGQMLLGEVFHTEPDGFWMEIHHMLLDTAGLSWHANGWQRG